MTSNPEIELWGGVECTVNRIGNEYFDQLELTGHGARDGDLELLAATGIRVVRYPVLWERVAPHGLSRADWSWSDRRLARLRELGVEPIVGLLHHGSGPMYTSLLDPEFPDKLAQFAGAVARRYPWVRRFTPINEPLTTARFSGLYGHWYPHQKSDTAFVRALFNQVRGVGLAMEAIRAVQPAAELVQTEDAARVYGRGHLSYQAEFENHRRWLTFDLLAGAVDQRHPLFGYLSSAGLRDQELALLGEKPCPPDVIGLNYYVTSDRFIDARLDRYPPRYHGGNPRERYADVEAVRASRRGIQGHKRVLLSAWRRYHKPIALTEVHLGGQADEQLCWLLEAWRACIHARRRGADVRAMTVWSFFGGVDWDSLVTIRRDHYEPGVFDVRAPSPRPTALFQALECLTRTGALARTPIKEAGWWRRESRLLYGQECAAPERGARCGSSTIPPEPRPSSYMLITGRGTLAQAFARVGRARELPYRVIGRDQMDIADRRAVRSFLEQQKPWAVINTAGFVRVDDAETQRDLCIRENTLGAATLADACRELGLPFVTFSSDLVFDGLAREPYVESARPRPLSNYGMSKAAAERRVMAIMPHALILRTSAFFGPWDSYNFLTMALRAIREKQRVAAAADLVVSPTYVPELVEVTLGLLMDGAAGIWHLANQGAVSWADFARAGARAAGLDDSLVERVPAALLNYAAPRPRRAALASERAMLMGTLENALERYFRECEL